MRWTDDTVTIRLGVTQQSAERYRRRHSRMPLRMRTVHFPRRVRAPAPDHATVPVFTPRQNTQTTSGGAISSARWWVFESVIASTARLIYVLWQTHDTLMKQRRLARSGSIRSWHFVTIAAVLSAEGRIAAVTYRIKLRTSTGRRIFSILYSGWGDVPPQVVPSSGREAGRILIIYGWSHRSPYPKR